jgi:hypothetical protein
MDDEAKEKFNGFHGIHWSLIIAFGQLQIFLWIHLWIER